MRPVLTILALLIPSTMQAQSHWALTAEAGHTTYSSAAYDTSTDVVHLRPWRPTVYTLRLSRESRQIGFGLGIGFAPGKLGVNVDDFALLPGESLHLIEIAPELSLHLGTTSAGATFRWHAGPLLDIWVPSGEDPRQRIGAQTGATLELPVARSWAVTLRADLAVSGSFINESEASDGLRRDATMRRGRLALGITRRL